jgi:hypothetical protein
MSTNGAGFSRAVLFCAEGANFSNGCANFRKRSRAREAGDNDWLRLTSDDQGEIRVFDGERCDA